MKKYVYFMTNNKHWIDLALRLRDEKIAEPILWMGDHNHYLNAKKQFGKDVVKDFDFFKFKSHKILKKDYKGKYNEFFISENYFIAKDRSLKMMDRIDDMAIMSRLDREAVFNMTVIWTLSRFEKELPDVLISIENPHTHIHYTILQICDFLKIPCIKFNSWTPLPLLSMYNALNGKIINTNTKITEKRLVKYEKEIDIYINDIYTKNKNYKTKHTEIERLESKTISWKTGQFIGLIKDVLRKYKSINSYNEHRQYNPLNPFRLNGFTKHKLIKKRKTNLKNSLNKSISNDVDLNDKFIYYGLHYEPERTTLPDGGIFHDQFLAILKLRELVPDNIKIYVKEHPSMFYNSLYGFRGRSPLFYSLIHSLNNVLIIDSEINTLDLIKSSLFTATISGTLGLESAIVGKKSLIFGNSWYDGCPNTFSWSENLNYKKIISNAIFSKEDVSIFLKSKLKHQSIIGLLNSKTATRFKNYIDDDFYTEQFNGLYNSLKEYFNTKL